MPNEVKVNRTAPAGEVETCEAAKLACTGKGPSAAGQATGGSHTGNGKTADECRECLGALAHRLAQPITALRGGLEIGLMGNRSAADYRSLLEKSLELADNVAQLVISLRDLGESGAPGGTPHFVSLETAAEDIQEELEALAESRDLRLQFTTQGTGRVCVNPDRLQEALQSLIVWVIESSAGGGVISLHVAATDEEARLFLSPSRTDFQYLQIKMLEDISTPGLLFAHASKNGALGWAISNRLLKGLGGKMELLTEGSNAGCIRVSFPLAPQTEPENLS